MRTLGLVNGGYHDTHADVREGTNKDSGVLLAVLLDRLARGGKGLGFI